MLNLLHQNRLCAVPKRAVTIGPFWDKSSFVASIEDAKPVLIQNRFCNLPHKKRFCACSKTGFVPTLNKPLPNRLCACSKNGFVPTLNQLLQNRLCAYSKTSFVPTLIQPLQNQLCAVPKPATPKPALCPRSTCRTKTGFASALNLPYNFE